MTIEEVQLKHELSDNERAQLARQQANGTDRGITREQGQEKQKGKMTAAAKAPRILESHIQQTVVEFLQLDGWRSFRTDPVSDGATVAKIRQAILGCPALNHVRELIFSLIKRCVRGKGFGEVGMPDYLFIRYADYADRSPTWASQAQVMWIEFKRPGEKPKPDQNLWHSTETARGALVMVVGEDCPATIEGVRAWYLASGLNRRIAA